MEKGTRVYTRPIREGEKPWAGKTSIGNRREGTGTVDEPILGNRGNAYFVRHEDGNYGAYWKEELTPIP